ncbi:MAG: metallophosphoesterase [Sphaerochaetaceae bacterium]
MKRKIYRVAHWCMGILSFALFSFVVWIGCNERNLAFLKWNPQYLYILLPIAVLSLLIPALTIVLCLRSKDRLGIVPVLLTVLGLTIAMVTFFSFGVFSPHTDKPVQLMLVDSAGSQGYPSVAAVWYTQHPTKSTLSYGTQAGRLSFEVGENHKQHTHGLIFENLIPHTTYYYSIDGQPEKTFTYFPEYQGGLRFLIGSDAHIGAETNDSEATVKILEQAADADNRYSAFFNLGDTVERGDNESQITSQMQLFSPYTSIVPIRSLMGNHDGLFGGDSRWRTYRYPAVLPSQSSGSSLYHRFDLSPSIHVFMLDFEWGTESYTAGQRAWFENELKDIDKDDLVIVMDHAYFFASSTKYHGLPWYDNQEMIDTFHKLFVDHGIDLVFSGHDHQMEHITRDGVEYFIVGALGGAFDNEPTYISPGSLFRDFSHHGYADLEINQGTVSVVLRESDGSALYSWKKQWKGNNLF